MNKKISPKVVSLVFGVLVVCFAIGFYALAAWTEPGVAPPGGNVDAPINVSSVGQYKSGTLRVAGLTVDSSTYLAAQSGNVGIGTTGPGTKLEVSGGSLRVKRHSSWVDASTANWFGGPVYFAPTTPSVSNNSYFIIDPDTTAGTIIFKGDFDGNIANPGSGTPKLAFMAGNVGIGTTSPGAKLEVAGQIKITGGSPGAGKSLISDASGLASWGTTSFSESDTLQTVWSRGNTITGNYLYVNSESAGPLRIGAAWGIKGLYAGDGGTGNLVLGVNPGNYVYLGVSNGDAWVQGGTGNAYFKGNVGIGTTSPGAKLDVLGAVALNRNYIYLAGAGDTNHAITNISGSDGEQFRYWNYLDFYSPNGGGNIRFLNNGNVGIGTTAPNRKLEINANSDGITFGQQADNTQTIQTYIDGHWSDRTTYAGGCCNYLLLQPDVGNVGIGTVSPSQKLDVAGYVKGQTGLCIGNDCRTSWPSGGGGVTSLSAGTGIILNPNPITSTGTISANTTYLQRRVTGTCAGNQAISAISSEGTVTCVALPSSAICTWGNKIYSTGAVCCMGVTHFECRADGSWNEMMSPCSKITCGI